MRRRWCSITLKLATNRLGLRRGLRRGMRRGLRRGMRRRMRHGKSNAKTLNAQSTRHSWRPNERGSQRRNYRPAAGAGCLRRSGVCPVARWLIWTTTRPNGNSSANLKNRNNGRTNMNKSESIASLAAALAKAQGEVENASKSATNPHFKSKYADLAEVLNTVRPVFSKNGLAIAQFPSFADGVVSVETVLTHSSGEWMSGTISAPVSKSDAQGVGSATTYCRRYSLAAVAGIAQEDDDANSAVGHKPQAKVEPSKLADHIAAIDAASALASLKSAFDDAVAYCRGVGDRLAEQAVIKAKDARKAKVAA